MVKFIVIKSVSNDIPWLQTSQARGQSSSATLKFIHITFSSMVPSRNWFLLSVDGLDACDWKRNRCWCLGAANIRSVGNVASAANWICRSRHAEGTLFGQFFSVVCYAHCTCQMVEWKPQSNIRLKPYSMFVESSIWILLANTFYFVET